MRIPGNNPPSIQGLDGETAGESRLQAVIVHERVYPHYSVIGISAIGAAAARQDFVIVREGRRRAYFSDAVGGSLRRSPKVQRSASSASSSSAVRLATVTRLS